MNPKVLALSIFCLISIVVNGQTKLYEMPDKKVFPEAIYLQIEEQIVKNDMKVVLYDSIIKSDTILYKVSVKPAYNKRKNPYQKFIDQKGEAFPLELFGIEKSDKPIFVNFWFTTCGPCIKEIPELQALKKKYKDQIDFYAITFNTKVQVDKFLAKRPIPFQHITDVQAQLTKYGVRSYPMNMLLDKDGKIQYVDGMINYSINELEHLMDKMVE